MNYSQALRYLNSFTNLEKLAQFPGNPFFNLKRMEHLLKISGHPEKHFFPVLIAGTTGKGSTGFFLESILKANGIRVGYYHSPHVETPRERIRVQSDEISTRLWAEGLSAIQKLLRKNPLPEAWGVLTYFEILTFLAIWIFAKTGVKTGIFEIGLGGRLDATNVLKAPLVILTPIHLDHEAFLGNTISKIAAEKAAIIKSQSHVVTGKQFPEAFKVISSAVKRNRGILWKANPVSGVPLGLAGDFQAWNAGVAMKAAEVLENHFDFSITPERSIKGLRSGNWKGRMESFGQGGVRFILDGAHNPISVKELVRSLISQKVRDPWLVFGAMNDKNSRGMLKVASRFFLKIILTGIPGNRAKPVAMLVQEAKGLFKCVLAAQNVGEAFGLARKASTSKASVVVTGSFYLVGEARRILKYG
ncbi:MAG: cyanophycin synthetase [Candidatus Omnitrophica bacterium]|nr:cyanophycin synthetase [Candidatus Omnitrophota bacterium]